MPKMSTSKQLLWDARTRVLLACASIPVMIETAYLYGIGDGDDTTMLFMLLAIVGCLLMALLPRIGGWAVVALWTARCVVPATTPFSPLFCLLMAVTIMAYLNIGMALAAAVVAEAATAARIWLYPWDSSVFVIVCATAAFLMVALWLGSMMGWRERQEIEEREHAELVRRVADQQLATQLHHSVANDLTTILLLSKQLQSDTDGSDQRIANDHDTITLIEQTAQESLAKVRTLIAGLDRQPATQPNAAERFAGHQPPDRQPASPTATTPNGQLTMITADELRSVAASHDARLHANGLDGATIISGEASAACTAERKAALLDILREIVGNMMKYADPAAGYCIAVTLTPGLTTLSASNGVRQAAVATTMPDDALSGGTGLDRCRRIAAGLGGEFTTEHDEASWSTLLKLPLA